MLAAAISSVEGGERSLLVMGSAGRTRRSVIQITSSVVISRTKRHWVLLSSHSLLSNGIFPCSRFPNPSQQNPSKGRGSGKEVGAGAVLNGRARALHITPHGAQ